jgi:hypothetical protein
MAFRLPRWLRRCVTYRLEAPSGKLRLELCPRHETWFVFLDLESTEPYAMGTEDTSLVDGLENVVRRMRLDAHHDSADDLDRLVQAMRADMEFEQALATPPPPSP